MAIALSKKLKQKQNIRLTPSLKKSIDFFREGVSFTFCFCLRFLERAIAIWFSYTYCQDKLF